MNTTINTSQTSEFIGNKLQYVFRCLKWVHGNVTRFFVTQALIVAVILAGVILTDSSLLLLSPYLVVSFIALLICGFLFLITQNAAEIEDNLNEIKEGLVQSKQHFADTKNDFTDKKFSFKSIVNQAGFVFMLTNLKDVSLDAKDGILSLVRVFTPLTAGLFVAAAVTTFLQYFAAMIALAVFIF